MVYDTAHVTLNNNKSINQSIKSAIENNGLMVVMKYFTINLCHVYICICITVKTSAEFVNHIPVVIFAITSIHLYQFEINLLKIVHIYL